MKRLLFLLFVLASFSINAQENIKVVYKQIDTMKLTIEVVRPETKMPKKGYPSVVFYFGGGWNAGTPQQFIEQAKLLKGYGIQSFLVDYRTKKSAKTSPKESVTDAKSAMRYIKANAKNLKVDLNKIAASGGSAGGHLAAATCYIDAFNDPSDNLKVSPRPMALILYNPVIDNSEKGYGYERVKDYYKEFSPMHNIKNPVPTIFFLGTKDKHVPVATGEKYKEICNSKGGRCDLHLYKNKEHGFINYGREDYDNVMKLTVDFLKSIKFIK